MQPKISVCLVEIYWVFKRKPLDRTPLRPTFDLLLYNSHSELCNLRMVGLDVPLYPDVSLH